MSIALLDKAGLRFWREPELKYRSFVVDTLNGAIQQTLKSQNRAWDFYQVEYPMLLPKSMISAAYTHDDVFFCDASLGDDRAVLRPETTSGSYKFADNILKTTNSKMPLCVWQVGKSFRVEKADGASASKMRYNEFTQAEWQCIYGLTTMADYRAAILAVLPGIVGWLCKVTDKGDVRIVESDRLPAYSESTMDIEVKRFAGRWTEVASISQRKDYPDAKVLEIAFGIDRIVDIAWEY